MDIQWCDYHETNTPFTTNSTDSSQYYTQYVCSEVKAFINAPKTLPMKRCTSVTSTWTEEWAILLESLREKKTAEDSEENYCQ